MSRWIIRVAAGLAILIVAGAIITWLLLRSLDLDRVVAGVERVVEEATGRALTIGSRPQVSLTPLIRLVVQDVKLANMEGGTRSEMLTLRSLEIGVTLRPLLEGRRPGLSIVLVEPDLLLEANERGDRNWILKLTPDEILARLQKVVNVLAGKVGLDSARIENATVRFEDRRRNMKLAVGARRAMLDLKPDERYELDFDGTLNGKPVKLAAEARVPGAGELASGRIRAALPGAALSAEGAVRPAWPANGSDVKVTLDVSDAVGLGAMLGVSVPTLPPIRFDAQLRGENGGLRATPMRLSAGRSRLTGNLGIVRFEPRPLVQAMLDAPVVDLAELMPPASAERREEKIFPATPLPLRPLHALDLESKLKIGRLVLPGSRSVEDFEASVSLASGRLKVAPFSLAAASGRVSGGFLLDARSLKTPQVDVELRSAGTDLGGLLALAGAPGADIKGAPTEMAIHLAARGDSIRAWMGGLNGQVRVVIGPGQLPGNKTDWGGSMAGRAFDLVNPFRKRDDGSPLKCGVVNVPVQRGVITIKDTIAGETDKVVGAVSGTIDLGQERLDLMVHSQAVEGIGPGLADFASAAKVTGSFVDPRIAVNMQGAAAAGLKIGAAVATFGATWLAESLVRKASPPHPCQIALGNPVDGKTATAPDETTAAPKKQEEKPGFFGRILGR